MREFNTTGLCVPRKHYMVDISGRVAQARAMVERGDYFCVNRGRQYGKTTLLAALRKELRADHEVVDLDFQTISHEDFEAEGSFTCAFAREMLALQEDGMLELPGDTVSQLEALGSGDNKGTRLANLFAVFARWMNGLPHDSGDSAESAPARVLAPRDPRSRSARSAG